MRSLVLDIEHRRLEKRDIPPPQSIEPNEVLFQVQEVGVCGTDREMVAFHLPRPEKDVPWLVLGHEALGQVVETGADVRGFARGDWVAPMIRRPCHPVCRSCARGRADLCLSNGYTERGIFGANGYYTELAVDPAEYLVRVPERLVPLAVLIEPLSVVEKAVARALAIRQTDENSALVLGLGPIGMLSALLLHSRGFRVRVYSLEPATHSRAALLRRQGIEYVTALDGPADLVIEAAGSAELALSAVRLLAPAGVFVTLGASQASGAFSFVDLIVGNRTVIGSVNTTREAFESAVRDLDVLPERALRAMIRRFAFEDYEQTLGEGGGIEPKFVHVMRR